MIRGRVIEAVERQQYRFQGTDCTYNADMNSDAVEHFCRLNSAEHRLMKILYDEMQMSARSYHKTLKMARTIADLEGREEILERDLMMAASFRVPENIGINAADPASPNAHTARRIQRKPGRI